MIEKIEISGLRGFALPREVRLAIPNGVSGSGLTLLTGPNNSGKSTIIEAIKVRSSFHQTPSFHVGMRNAKTDAVSIAYTIDGEIETLSSSRPGSSETVANRSSNIAPYVVPSRRQFAPYFGKSASGSRDQYIKNFGSFQGFREQILSGFESRLFDLENSHFHFNKLIKEVVPDFMDWSIDQNEGGQYFVKLKSNSKTHSLSGSGDGIISVFVIIASLFDSNPGDVIAIDEPELSLHPSIQRRLSGVIRRFSSDRQIIISTHSAYFVEPSALSAGAEVVRTWDRGEAIEVFQLSVNTCKSLKRILSPNSNNPHVFGLDAREIFFSDDPILVFEGQEDVVFWPKVAARESGLDKLSVYGWGAGGAANMENVVNVLKALGYRKVVGILDDNRPKDFAKLSKSFPEYCFIAIPAADIRTKAAVPARDAVVGLLDEEGNVRENLVADLEKKLKIIRVFIDK